jgi:ribA/ribD-fused uncharacterized protein
MIGPFKGDFEFLSNFYPSCIFYQEIWYPTVEHAFQAAKTLDTKIRYEIADLPTPGQAKKKGGRLVLRPNWNDMKIDVMSRLVFKKFNDPLLRKKLLDTGEEELVEKNWWNDVYWGVCNGVGENNLGKILMKTRSTMREWGDI